MRTLAAVGGLLSLALGTVACSGDGPRAARTSGGSAVSTVTGLEWREGATSATERSEVAATAVGSRLYTAGGFDADGATVATVEVYDTDADRWAPAPDLPVAVNHAMAATFDGAPYVFGGYDRENRATTGVYRLDGDRWQRVSTMPKGRGAGTAVTLGSTIYVVGGVEAGTAPATDMLVFEPAADRWTVLPGPPTPREHLGGAGFGGTLYIVGGRASGIGNYDALEAYDTATRTWSTLPPLPTRRGGLAAAATCNGEVVAVGGEAEATFPEAEAFEVATGRWRALPDTPTARHGLGVVAVGTRVVVLQGGRTPGLSTSDVTEILDLASLGPCR